MVLLRAAALTLAATLAVAAVVALAVPGLGASSLASAPRRALRGNGSTVHIDKGEPAQPQQEQQRKNTTASANEEKGLWRGVNAGCIAVRGGQLLVVQQRSGLWSIPGGTGEAGESDRRTAERETYEETGYHVSAGSLLTTWSNGFRIYRCSVHGDSSGSKDHHEVSGYGWRRASELQGMRWRFPDQAALYAQWMR